MSSGNIYKGAISGSFPLPGRKAIGVRSEYQGFFLPALNAAELKDLIKVAEGALAELEQDRKIAKRIEIARSRRTERCPVCRNDNRLTRDELAQGRQCKSCDNVDAAGY